MEVEVVNTLDTGVSTSFKMPARGAEAQLVECMPMQGILTIGQCSPSTQAV